MLYGADEADAPPNPPTTPAKLLALEEGAPSVGGEEGRLWWWWPC